MPKKKIIELAWDEKRSIQIEVDEEVDEKDDLTRIDPDALGDFDKDAKKDLRKSIKTVSQTLEELKPCIQDLVNKLSIQKPSEINIQFGLKLESGAKVVFVSASGELHFNVSIKWNH
ncbi:CU044_2847 family protein [Dethiosulfatarculus sandiegensis]|uniref:Trypsin-co-occurring domain-containing protein n=1 Tax=Dethiosulfatarculus sandiegensis TaxID=1429043 RepID=A0A0D2GCJ9_9BACT|nr:CU044_2847 family protein [Dethiosulfatarculus sandiegensis]KIX12652.1 hypothetical protein X474_18075 [Dethiosulfatarculus sandiegensis]